MRKFSEIVSAIFNFYFWTPISIFAAVLKTGLEDSQIVLVLPISLVLDVILPMLIFLLLVKIGKIKNASLVKREDRPLIFGLSTLLFAVSTLLSFFLANNLFFAIHLLMFIAASTVFLITLFFKISGHVLINFRGLKALGIALQVYLSEQNTSIARKYVFAFAFTRGLRVHGVL